MYRTPTQYVQHVVNGDDKADDETERIDETRRRDITRPGICEYGCKEVFDITKGVRHDLPNSPLFCSKLCAYRHKKRLLARNGVMMK